MKNLSPFLSIILLLLTTGCLAQKENKEVLEIRYEAQTRGRSEIVIFKHNTLLYKDNTSSKEHVLSDKNCTSIQEAVSEINVVEISNLKAPSERRIFDGAMTTTISIKKGKENYTSSSFDHDNPPKKLKPLVDLLKSFLK